ncbi:MAG: protein-ADP-ribose hydrolase [Lachnospiraceae bacterium]
MTQKERLEYLLKAFLAESPHYQGMGIPESTQERKQLLRSLVNVRTAKPVEDSLLEIQDAYLQEELSNKGVVHISKIEEVKPQIYLWQGDITRLKADAIVNAANSALLGCFVPCHGCIDNAIHTYAGVQLRLECNSMMDEQGHDEPIGSAKITKAYNLPSRYVIHTVGPIVAGKLSKRDCGLLASCYQSCLKLAQDYQLSSIAFCCISTGEFHFPQEEAAKIAISTVTEFLREQTSVMEVIFNAFKESDYQIYKHLLTGS